MPRSVCLFVGGALLLAPAWLRSADAQTVMPWASSVVLNFENFADGTLLTTQYPGVTFTNTQVLTAGLSLDELEFPPHSGVNVITDSGGPISLLFSAPITYFSVYATYAVPLTLNAYVPGGTLDTVTSKFSSNDALFGDPGSSPNEFFGVFDPRGITKVTLTGDPNGGSFVADDISYTPKSPGDAIPEPAPVLLLTLGLMALLLRRRPAATDR